MESLPRLPTRASRSLSRVRLFLRIRLRKPHCHLALTRLKYVAEIPARSNLKKPLHLAPVRLSLAIP